MNWSSLSRRSFVAGVILGASTLTLGGCALESASKAAAQSASNNEDFPLSRLDPAGGGDYPVVQMGDPSLAHPLDGNFDEFQPPQLKEDGGTRVATPFYSVYLPDDLFPDGFIADYSPAIPDDEWGEGLLRGHDLTVRPAAGGQGIHVCVTTANWTGIQGDGIALSAGPVASDSTFHVVIEGPCDRRADPFEEQARRDLYEQYKLVSPYIVAARAEGNAWEAVEVDQVFPEVTENEGLFTLSVPEYSVSADPSVWQKGLSYRFYEEEVAVENRDGPDVSTLGTMTDFLALFSGDGQDLLCWVFAYDGSDNDLAYSNRLYLQRAIGTTSDESGRAVYLAVPMHEMGNGDADQLEEATERAESDMEIYATAINVL